MKRIFVIFLMLSLFIGGCTQPSDPKADQEDRRLKIVATTFPQYDWVRQILGERADDTELLLLLDDGTDLHSFQPSVEDIANIADSDLFIYVGGESDSWVHDALESTHNDHRVLINLLEILDSHVKNEEVVEGMEHHHDHEHEEDHEHEHEEAHEHEHEHEEADEHVWLSLKNAILINDKIVEALSELDPYHANEYKQNGEVYTDKLSALDDKYQQALSDTRTRTLVFADRFPFRYLLDDYEIEYYAAFSGCSAEVEASFETVIFLAKKVNELELSHVMTIESSDLSMARTVIENTVTKDQEILVLDSMQSITSEQVASGISYLSIMEKNLQTLQEALQ